ncbi:MAG: LptA/OstA family protein [Kiritimatiellaeota bacterium]|nr:LptA/OstA family protein [Kiritimatiellota bacterium]
MQVGLAAAGVLLVPWLACAQAADAGAKAEAEAKKKPPLGLFAKDAKAGDKDAPPRETVITADEIDGSYKEGVVLFDGNVMVDDAQFILRCDRLMLFMDDEGQEASQVMAVGNVSITNEMRHATCDKAVYTKKDAQIVLDAEGDDRYVHLVTQGDTAGMAKGRRVVYSLDTESVRIIGRPGEQASVGVPALGGGLKNVVDGEGRKQPKPDAERERQK